MPDHVSRYSKYSHPTVRERVKCPQCGIKVGVYKNSGQLYIHGAPGNQCPGSLRMVGGR